MEPPSSPPPSGSCASARDRVAVDPAPLGAGAARRRHGADRGAVGRGFLGDVRIMSAALAFRNLTLGYDRHPAVHHLHGEMKSGALMAVVGPNGAGKSTLFKGIVGMHQAARRRHRSVRPARARHRLPAAGRRHRPHLPDQRLRHGRDGAVARRRPVRRHRQARARQGARRDRRPSASRASRSGRSARSRAGRCSARCSRGCCCRTRA